MGDSLDGSGEPTPEAQNVAMVDYTSFANFLRKIVTVLAPEEDGVPHAFITALDDKSHQEYIRKFIGDFQVWALCLQRSSTKGNIKTNNLLIIIII